MTEVQKLTQQAIQAAKNNDAILCYELTNKINDLLEIEELTKELIQAAKDDDTISCYELTKRINDIKER